MPTSVEFSRQRTAELAALGSTLELDPSISGEGEKFYPLVLALVLGMELRRS